MLAEVLPKPRIRHCAGNQACRDGCISCILLIGSEDGSYRL